MTGKLHEFTGEEELFYPALIWLHDDGPRGLLAQPGGTYRLASSPPDDGRWRPVQPRKA